MKHILIAVALLSTIAAALAQSTLITTTKEELMKYNSLNEVYNLPPGYQVMEATFYHNDPRDGQKWHRVKWSQGVIHKSVKELMATLKTGDKIGFIDVAVIKDGRKIKLASKDFIIL